MCLLDNQHDLKGSSVRSRSAEHCEGSDREIRPSEVGREEPPWRQVPACLPGGGHVGKTHL